MDHRTADSVLLCPTIFLIILDACIMFEIGSLLNYFNWYSYNKLCQNKKRKSIQNYTIIVFSLVSFLWKC